MYEGVLSLTAGGGGVKWEWGGCVALSCTQNVSLPALGFIFQLFFSFFLSCLKVVKELYSHIWVHQFWKKLACAKEKKFDFNALCFKARYQDLRGIPMKQKLKMHASFFFFSFCWIWVCVSSSRTRIFSVGCRQTLSNAKKMFRKIRYRDQSNTSVLMKRIKHAHFSCALRSPVPRLSFCVSQPRVVPPVHTGTL